MIQNKSGTLDKKEAYLPPISSASFKKKSLICSSYKVSVHLTGPTYYCL